MKRWLTMLFMAVMLTACMGVQPAAAPVEPKVPVIAENPTVHGSLPLLDLCEMTCNEQGQCIFVAAQAYGHVPDANGKLFPILIQWWAKPHNGMIFATTVLVFDSEYNTWVAVANLPPADAYELAEELGLEVFECERM